MKKLQIYLTKEQIAQIKTEAIAQDKPYAVVIRDAIDLYLGKARQPKSDQPSWQELADKYAQPMGGNIDIDQELYGE